MQNEFGPNNADAIWAAASLAESYMRRVQRRQGELWGCRESGIWRHTDIVHQQLRFVWRSLQLIQRWDRYAHVAAAVVHAAIDKHV